MKKFLTCASIVLATLLSASCSDSDEGGKLPSLKTPAPTVDETTITEYGFTVNWNAVEHAASYLYKVDNGPETPVSENSIALTGLSAGQKHTVSVKAVSEDPEKYLDSAWGTATASTAAETPKASYSTGDYYHSGEDSGIVAYIEPDSGGKRGMIISLDETKEVWSTEINSIGYNWYDGQHNTAKVREIEGWETKYPAFKWCVDHGEGWFFPSSDEMKWLASAFNGDVEGAEAEAEAAFNNTIVSHGGTALSPATYWSSTELNRECGVYIFLGTNNVTCIDPEKNVILPVRAAKYFQITE